MADDPSGGRASADDLDAQLLRDIVENVQLGLYVYRLEETAPGREELRMVLANPASEALTGLAPAGLVGKTIDECFPGLRQRGTPDVIMKVIETGQSRQITDFQYGDDRVLDRAWSFSVFPLPGRSAGVAFEDITERKRTELDLRESELRFRALYEHTNDAVLTFDLAGRVLSANERATELFDLSSEQLLGLRYADLVVEEEVEDAGRVLQSLVGGRPVPPYERTLCRADGTQLSAEVSASLVPDDRGAPSHLQSVIRDVTERKATEAALQQTQRLESLGVLAGGIAHDFNNLLTSIMGHADLVSQEVAEDSPGGASLAQIERAALRASELTQQLLAYAGRAHVDAVRLDLNGLVREMGGLLEHALPRRIAIDLELQGELLPVLGDAAQLRQVVMNLITNAAESYGDRSGTVSVKTWNAPAVPAEVASGPETARVCLEVSDAGCGMDEDTRDRLFDPFFTTKMTGRGLGLAAVHGIVKGHGGELTVDSEVDRGSIFRLTLPVDAAAVAAIAEDAEDAEDAEAEAEEAVAESPWGAGRGQILVADDQDEVRELLTEIVARAGYAALPAADGPEAVRLFRESPEVRAAVLDLSMREMDGDQAGQLIRELRPEVPVILMSGYAAADTRARFSGLGFAGFLQKPFAPLALIELLREVLDDSP